MVMALDRRRLSFALVAASGVYVAHAVAYLLAHPDPLLRADALSGHGYLQIAMLLLGPALALGVAGLAVRNARAAALGDHVGLRSLATAVTVGFAVLEVVERVPAGQVTDVLTEPAVPLGLLLAGPIAVALHALVVGVRRVAEVVTSPPGRIPASTPLVQLAAAVPLAARIDRRIPLSPLTRRGPPVVIRVTH